MRCELDESTLEVIKLLQDKNRKKQDKVERAKADKEAFTDSANRFIAETIQILSPLNPYGITCVKEPTDLTRDFGMGEITVQLEKLIVKEGVDIIIMLEPFNSHVDRYNGLRFQAIYSKTGPRTIVQNPPPFGEHMGWHMWMNEDDKSVDPKYLKIDKEGWMVIIKNHLLSEANS